MDFHSAVAAMHLVAVACAHSLRHQHKYVRQRAENVTPCLTDKDKLGQLSARSNRLSEQCSRLKDDPCLSKHAEVTIPLLDTQETTSEFAGRLKAIQAGCTSLDDDVDTLAGRKLQEQLNWVHPAADMLEDSLKRLWLHLHLVRVGRNNGNMDADEPKREDFPGWIDLRPISVVAAQDLNDRSHHDTFERSTSVNCLALVVDSTCRVWEQEAAIWHGNPDVTGQQAPSQSMTKGWDYYSPSRDASGGSKASGSCQSPQQRAKGGQAHPYEPGKIVGATSRVKDKLTNAAWLFSDQLDPATVRPMFGCLLRTYKTFNSLHLSRVNALCRIDMVLELPPRKGDGMKAAGLGSLGTIHELTNCAGWLLDQSASVGSDRAWEAVLPRNDLERHFALRAAYCVIASIRPLTPNEVFAASKTVARPEDPEWPWEGATHLFEITKWLLEVGDGNVVRFRSRDLEQCTAQTKREAHAFLARVSLTHLQDMEPRIVIWPWSRYIELKGDRKRYPLHDYVSNSWQHHYSQAEIYLPEMPGQLHRLIEGAWLAERTEPSTRNRTGAEVDLDAYNEALDVGLILCESYGFQKLKSAYVNMGARKHELKSKDAFDFSSWHLVEPLDPS